MKHASVFAFALAATLVASCKVDLNSILHKPGGGSGSASGSSASTGGDAADHGHGPEGTTTTVATGGDLCKQVEGEAWDVTAARQDKADHTTLCEMVTVDPAPGVATIAPRKPGFCDQLSKDDLANGQPKWATSRMKSVVAWDTWWSNTPEVLGSLCISPDDPQVQKETGYFYQWWSNLTGLPPEQLDGLFKYMAVVPGDNESSGLYAKAEDDACKAFPEASPEASDRDRKLSDAMRTILGCSASGVPFWISETNSDDLSWHYDTTAAPPSELMRAYVTLRCLGTPDKIEDRNLAAYAVCGTDARALDDQRLEKEIASYGDLAKAHARMTFAAAQRLTARFETAAQTAAKADPGWQALIYDAPAQGWKTWDALYTANQKAIDAARAYEPLYYGPSRKAAKGCWDHAWKDFTSYVGKAKASTLVDAKHAMTDTVGTILLEHVASCADAEGDETIARYLGQLFEYGRPARGPRYETYFAVLDSLATIKADRSKFPVEPDWFAAMYTERSPFAKSGGGDVVGLDLAGEDRGGVVKKVKKDGDGVLVEFKTDRWKEEAQNCVETDRILMFRTDGSPIYEQNCKDAGEQWVEQTHDTIWVPAAVADGIAPGRFVRSAVGTSRHGDAWDSMPVEVWQDKDRKVLTAYVGVEL